MRILTFVCVALLAGQIESSRAQPRHELLALVIGNADYNDNGRLETDEVETAIAIEDGFAADLKNSINDATLLRDRLTSLGYSVDYHTNLDLAEMEAAFNAFARRVARAPASAKVIIYYGGHALDVGGTMYLLPTSATRPEATIDSTTPLEPAVMAQLGFATTDFLRQLRPASGPGFSLFVIDGCRTDPWPTHATNLFGALGNLFATAGTFEASERDRELPERTAVAYASAYGQTASDGEQANSPFAIALSARLETRELSVAQVLSRVRRDTFRATNRRQIAEMGGHSLTDTCIAECAPGYPTADPARPAPAQ